MELYPRPTHNEGSPREPDRDGQRPGRRPDPGHEHVQVEAVLVHDGRVLGGAHVLDGLGADRGPVHRVVGLPAAVRARRHQPRVPSGRHRVGNPEEHRHLLLHLVRVGAPGPLYIKNAVNLRFHSQFIIEYI